MPQSSLDELRYLMSSLTAEELFELARLVWDQLSEEQQDTFINTVTGL